MNDIELLDRGYVERGLAAVGRNIGNLAIAIGRVLMEDIESLRPTDIEALQDGIPHHVVIDVDARLLADDFAILVEDIKDTRFAPRDEDALVLGIDHGVCLEAGAVQVVINCLVFRSTTPICC